MGYVGFESAHEGITTHTPYLQPSTYTGGPLSFDGFIKPQHELQLKILARMRLLGITPVLPAFAGFLPPAFVDRLPANTSVTR